MNFKDGNLIISKGVEVIRKKEFYKENSEHGLVILLNGEWGTGKTTFARSIENNKYIMDEGIKKIHLVFSQDFVNNNIYISTSDNYSENLIPAKTLISFLKKNVTPGNTSKS